MSNLPIITPEQRLLMQEKAKASREAKKLAGESLKQEWADENYWREPAQRIGGKALQLLEDKIEKALENSQVEKEETKQEGEATIPSSKTST